ncbi:MAG: thioredoxin family protein [Bacteroidetes bacterium]|nr:MAG: thioredoxin family protein [Bacteroidota bacterium]PTM11579.1 MAG: thioredoxin family protein [Bacteroidota bacterium]
MEAIAWQNLPGVYTYPAYCQMIDALLEQGKTTGHNHSPAMLHYTELNVARMRRLDKTTKLTAASLATVKAIDRPQTWLTITEAWCGDAAQIIPVIELLAAANPLLTHRLILRDEHLDIMDVFLTNGISRAIPITIFLDTETNAVLGSWGPRPAELQAEVQATQVAALTAPTPAAREAMVELSKINTQKWYVHDKGVAIQQEMLEALLGGV